MRIVGPHAGPGRRIHDAIDAELDGGRVDLGAVVEQDVLPELERVEERIGRDLLRFGGVRHELAFGREAEKPAADVHRDPVKLVAWRSVEIKVGDLIAVGDAQRATAFRRLRFGKRRIGDDHSDEDGQSEHEAEREALHAHGVPPLALCPLCSSLETGRTIGYLRPPPSYSTDEVDVNRGVGDPDAGRHRNGQPRWIAHYPCRSASRPAKGAIGTRSSAEAWERAGP